MHIQPSSSIGMDDQSSEILQNVFKALQQADPSYENVSYGMSVNNSFPSNWLIQSGPDDTECQFLQTIQQLLKSFVIDQPTLSHFIDLSQMGNQNSRDEFQSAMIESISAIAQVAKAPVIIRYIEGNPAGSSESNTMTFINHLKNAYQGPTNSQVYFYAVSFVKPWEGAPIPGLPGSWTHAKMVAVDGQSSTAGGMNFWNDYLPSHTPPHDVSININGAAAGFSHLFANAIWQYAAGPQRSGSIFNASWQLGTANFGQQFPPQFDPNTFITPVQPQAIPVLAVGNLGLWESTAMQSLLQEALAGIANPAKQVNPQSTYQIVENAFNVLLSFPFSNFDTSTSKATNASTTARHLILQQVSQNGHIRLSQQKIADTDLVERAIKDGKGGVPWPGQMMDALVDAMVRKNAKLDIIVSFHQTGLSPVDGYSDDMGAAALKIVFIQLLTRALGGDANKANSLANQLLTIKATTDANHAKIWIVDDLVFYVGSDNVYPAYLQEFGYVIGSQQLTELFIQNYWEKMWQIAR